MSPLSVLLVFPKLASNKRFHHLPIGCLSLAAPLAYHEIDFAIFDERVDPCEKFDELVSQARIVGVSMFTGYQTHRGYHWLERTRELNPGAITVVGGPHISALPEQAASDHNVDYAIAGYGESSFLKLVKLLLGEQQDIDIYSIPGLYARLKEGPCSIPSAPRFDQASWYPLPFESIDVKKYINPETRLIMYLTHYGCPAMCTFCATPETRKWTQKPIELVRNDLDRLYEIYPYKEVCFFDATMFTNKKRVWDILDYLDKYDSMKWVADGRAIELAAFSVDELRELNRRRSVLINMVIGLESGSQRVVEGIMKKGRGHLGKYREVASKLQQADISFVSGLVLGVPGETPEDLLVTMSFIKEIREISPKFRLSSTFFRPLPGTHLFNELCRQGYSFPGTLADWAKDGGAKTGFSYNEWMNIPWMDETSEKAYRAAYHQFLDQHGDILIGDNASGKIADPNQMEPDDVVGM
jgi:anaerobic magnesium-protoporphyrin IX monomethyl ester cyclase